MKKYIKLKSIGHGSYSKVFLVQNTSSESTYAVKVIPKNKLEILMREKVRTCLEFSCFTKLKYISLLSMKILSILIIGLKMRTISTSLWSIVPMGYTLCSILESGCLCQKSIYHCTWKGNQNLRVSDCQCYQVHSWAKYPTQGVHIYENAVWNFVISI